MNDDGDGKRIGRRHQATRALSLALFGLAIAACSVAPGSSASFDPSTNASSQPGATGSAGAATMTGTAPTAVPAASATATVGATAAASPTAAATRTPTSDHLGPLPSVRPVPTENWTGVKWVASRVPSPGQAGASSNTMFTSSAWSGGYFGFWNMSSSETEGKVEIYSTTSRDGLTWTAPIAFATTKWVAVAGVLEARGVLLATGSVFGATCSGPNVVGLWVSANGTSWTAIDMTKAFGDGSVREIEAGAGGFIATGGVADTDAIWTSRDGVAWTRAKLPNNFLVGNGVTFSGGYVVAGTTLPPEFAGCGGGVLTPSIYWSKDGDGWAEQTLPGSLKGSMISTRVTRVTDGVLLAIETSMNDATGDPVSAAWSSIDGRTWTKRSQPWDDGWLMTDGRRAVLNANGKLYRVDAQLNLTELVETGDVRGPGNGSIGPTGILIADSDGQYWIGVPTID